MQRWLQIYAHAVVAFFYECGARVSGALAYALPKGMCSVFVKLGDSHHLSERGLSCLRSSMYDLSAGALLKTTLLLRARSAAHVQTLLCCNAMTVDQWPVKLFCCSSSRSLSTLINLSVISVTYFTPSRGERDNEPYCVRVYSERARRGSTPLYS